MKYIYAITSLVLLVVSIFFVELLAGLNADDSVKRMIGVTLALIFFTKYELYELRDIIR